MPSRTGRPWQRLKRRVIRRDGGVCHICGGLGADSADHIVPWSVSHDDSMANLAAVHHDVEPKCNRRRGARSLTHARQAMAALVGDSNGWDW